MQYKCVPAPSELVIDNKGSYDGAVRSFADIINREAKGGWNFHSMENIAVRQQPGCLAGLFGQKETTVYFNMLVFSKEGESIGTVDRSAIYDNSTTKPKEQFNNNGLETNPFFSKKCGNCGQLNNNSVKSCTNCGSTVFNRI